MPMRLTRRTWLLATGAALVPSLRTQAAETVKLGLIAPLTGVAAESGHFEVNGAKLALQGINAAGGVLGRQLELLIDDDQSTNPGGVLAFSRLASRGDIVAFIGPIRSTLTHAIAPDVLRLGKPMMFGGTDPALTHMGHRWLFRCRPNDVYSARVMADFGVKELRKQRWAVVHSTDAFGASGMRALVDALAKLEIKPALVQGYANQTPDFTPIVLAVKQAGADVIATYITFENDLGVFARQLHQLGVTADWIGSPTNTSFSSLALGGRALYGTYAVADFAADSSPAARTFADRFQEVYKQRSDQFNAWPFDAVTLLARAINDAGGTDPERIRAAILAIRGFKGAEGEHCSERRRQDRLRPPYRVR
jgi:branched-chain amino acid transport system substrate-binding protein